MFLDFLRYPSKEMKEPAARLLLKLNQITKNESIHIIQALDQCDIKKAEVIDLIYEICIKSPEN